MKSVINLIVLLLMLIVASMAITLYHIIDHESRITRLEQASR